jgi:hypothetical protein
LATAPLREPSEDQQDLAAIVAALSHMSSVATAPLTGSPAAFSRWKNQARADAVRQR